MRIHTGTLTHNRSATALFWCPADAASAELIHSHDMGKPVLDVIHAGEGTFWVLLDAQWTDPSGTATASIAKSFPSVKLIHLTPTKVRAPVSCSHSHRVDRFPAVD